MKILICYIYYIHIVIRKKNNNKIFTPNYIKIIDFKQKN